MQKNEYEELEKDNENVSPKEVDENLETEGQEEIPEEVESSSEFENTSYNDNIYKNRPFENAFNKTNGDKNYYRNKKNEAEDNLEKARRNREKAQTEKDRDYKKIDPNDETPFKSDGSDVTSKNRQDRKKDKKELKQANRELKDAERELKDVKRDSRLDKIYRMAHPIKSRTTTIKNKAKKVVKEKAKSILKNKYILIPIIFFGAFLVLAIFVSVLTGEAVSPGNTSGIAASTVKYEVNGITLDNVKVKIVNAAGETIETVNFEKYLMSVTLVKMGRESLSNNPEAFKAALIITRNDILTDDKDYSLSVSSDTITTSVDNSKYIYWDYTKPLYKVENEDGTESYSPDITDKTPGAIVVEATGLSESESASLESISGEVLGKYMKDSNDSSKLVDTTLDETKLNSIIALGSQNKDYEQILASTYGAANITIEDGAITYTYTGATGDFINWKQSDPLWGKTIIKNGKTMGKYGCLITSYAIAIAALDAETTLPDFNPGTFLNALKKEGAFCGDGAGLNCPGAINKIVPNITINRTFDSLKGKTKEEKIQYVRENIQENCMMVLQVKTGNTGDTHFAVLDVEGSEAVNWTTLKIYDPAMKNGSVFENQKYKNKMSEIRLVCLK